MIDDLTRALGDLAGTMTDDPKRLAGVHRRVRRLRARRTARRGAVATGALGVAAATGGLWRPTGSAPAARVTATQPPSTTASTVVRSCGEAPTTTRPAEDFPILTSLVQARVLAVEGDSVTFELLDRPADSSLPATLTLTAGPEVEFADGDVALDRADLVPGLLVELFVLLPQGATGWELAHVQIDPLDDSDAVTVPTC